MASPATPDTQPATAAAFKVSLSKKKNKPQQKQQQQKTKAQPRQPVTQLMPDTDGVIKAEDVDASCGPAAKPANVKLRGVYK